MPQILTELARYLLEQRARLLLFARHGDACLDDGGVGRTNAGSRAHRRGEIPGPDAAVHPCRMVGTRQEIRESCQYLGLQLGGQLLRRQTSRTSCSALLWSPSVSKTRARASRPFTLVGLPPRNRRTVAGSRFSCQSVPSARRRNSARLGHAGLSRIKAA